MPLTYSLSIGNISGERVLLVEERFVLVQPHLHRSPNVPAHRKKQTTSIHSRGNSATPVTTESVTGASNH